MYPLRHAPTLNKCQSLSQARNSSCMRPTSFVASVLLPTRGASFTIPLLLRPANTLTHLELLYLLCVLVAANTVLVCESSIFTTPSNFVKVSQKPRARLTATLL